MNKNLLAIAAILSFFCVHQSWSTPVYVTNDLNVDAHISITYRGLFCDNDIDKRIAPGQTWSTEAGACLITKINPSIARGTETIYGLPYLSSGTGYRNFRIVQQGNQFGVINK